MVFGTLSDHVKSVLGAKKECFKQFLGSKELHPFLEQFWMLSKQDQDSIAPCSVLKSMLLKL